VAWKQYQEGFLQHLEQKVNLETLAIIAVITEFVEKVEEFLVGAR